jgi:hypothetical protein
MDDAQLKSLGDALKRTKKSRVPYYFSYVASDADGEAFLCVSKRVGGHLCDAEGQERGPRAEAGLWTGPLRQRSGPTRLCKRQARDLEAAA